MQNRLAEPELINQLTGPCPFHIFVTSGILHPSDGGEEWRKGIGKKRTAVLNVLNLSPDSIYYRENEANVSAYPEVPTATQLRDVIGVRVFKFGDFTDLLEIGIVP